GRDVSPFAAAPSCVLLAALDDRGVPLARVHDHVSTYLAPFSVSLARRADARGAPPWALFRTDLLRASWLVIWRDIAGTLEAAPIARGMPDAPVPLNTCYGVAVPDEYTACWLAAHLNSRPVRSVALVLAERAGGGAFRFNASTVGALPLPTHPDTPAVRALARIGRDAARGGGWDPDELDTHAVQALGLDDDTASFLRHLGDTLRRDPGRDR
ncbi:MAG: hypothetical protein AABZ35_06325, partial [Gemmatimonadota bacterium]